MQNYPGTIYSTPPPIVAELQAAFDALEDETLITKLIGPIRRGPKGHHPRVLFHLFVTKHIMGLDSTAALLRTLRNNPFIAVDCEYELPIAANVSPGNVHDAKRASNLLAEARYTHKGHNTNFVPKYVLADQGYSGKPLRRLIIDQYWAEPVIQVNKGHKRLMALEGEKQNTPGWKALYKQRQSVERAFSRLKGQRSLNRIKVRRSMKVTLHCYLSLIAIQVQASPNQPSHESAIGQRLG